MTDDMFVLRIADGRPKGPCPWTINFNQHRNASHIPLPEDSFYMTDELSSYALAAMTGAHDQAVYVSSPPIERPKYRAHNLSILHGKEESGCWIRMARRTYATSSVVLMLAPDSLQS